MRALIQRVSRCSIAIHNSVHSSIGQGMLILLGVRSDDVPADAEYLAVRSSNLRIFSDAEGKMNFSIDEVHGSAMVVSQFTLYADTRKGNRPSYTDSAPPESAEKLYEHFLSTLRSRLGAERVAAGVFREMMKVELVNDGPVTVLLESKPHLSTE